MSPTLDLDRLFQGARVPEWLRSLEAEPVRAMEDLLVGKASLGHLGADEPIEILFDWFEGLDSDSGFVELVDGALADWIERNWGDSALAAAFGSAAMTAEAWTRTAELVANEPRLEQSASQLRKRLAADPGFLIGLSENCARDLEGRRRLAVARHLVAGEPSPRPSPASPSTPSQGEGATSRPAAPIRKPADGRTEALLSPKMDVEG